MATRIQLRRDTAAQWTANNPTLSTGEAGYESDTGKLKIGNGSASWTSLSYIQNAVSDVIGLQTTLNGKAPLESPALTGTPTAPTAAAGTNNTQIATTAYADNAAVSAAASIVDSAPETLNTLNELAAALGDDPNFATTVSNALGNKQPLDADLTAIAALSGTSGFLKKTAENTWSLDTSTYLTGNESISLSGDVTGSGTTAITVTLANSGVVADTYGSATAIPVITVDAKGRITGVTTSSVEGLPSQSGNAGKYLTTNGTVASWGTIEEGLNPLLLGGM